MQNHQSRNFHIGLIGDGVRRWARKNNVEMTEAYVAAMKNVAIFIDFFFESGANILSLYLLSKENLSRAPQDLQAAVDGEVTFLQTVLPGLVEKWNCRIYLAGMPDLLPNKYLEAVDRLVKIPYSDKRKIYLLAAYNPLDEICQAIEQADKKNGKQFEEFLWVKEPVDLVVRTSGEHRISNFLPLQIGYAELYFIQKHVNELEAEDLKIVLEDYHNRRSRRFGK